MGYQRSLLVQLQVTADSNYCPKKVPYELTRQNTSLFVPQKSIQIQNNEMLLKKNLSILHGIAFKIYILFDKEYVSIKN